ncbi:MAG: MoaD/ThiS family protein [Deltaproteobacteria bacterium]|nr:MoaD/ThiS family protein [Deltaproteobacteria bacterium]MBW2016970.1 MoaD/ThiS family protein [Deltaproteobacteria bacterium]MBW2129375.1 MoaD/ThiS family protein [Deltaproteobacteria bacterium]MBW2303716.1 MoaD/ThiS family protein [Deltaproteobacteria bacterium]
MALRIFLSSSLRKFVPSYDPDTGLDLTVEKGASVAEVCGILGIPADSVKVIMVDGRSKSLDHTLTGNERVALFPPVGGG